jgi:hypothetical protein
MFLAIFFILLVIWILGWVAFHVDGGLIHLLLVLAVISLAGCGKSRSDGETCSSKQLFHSI